MDLVVTARHCSERSGENDRNNNLRNPVAFALSEALNDKHVVVTKQYIHTSNFGRIATPGEVSVWLQHWNDKSGLAGPNTFKIPLDLGEYR